MVDTAHITTAEQLLEAGDIGRCELIRGQLHMMTPAGYRHGRIVSRLSAMIATHALKHRLGDVVAGDAGFFIERNPDTVRAPDIAFIAAARAPRPEPRGYTDVMPDLVVEVNSPDDRSGEVLEKVQMWLAAGVKLVWVVEPQTRSVQVYHPDGTGRVHNDQQQLDGGDVLPGFIVPVARIFDEN